MNLEDINAYLQIVSNGSLSRAAKAMRLPKASVSHRLKRLENELGTPLFLRTANQMTLNDAGRDFYEHALAIRRASERALDAAVKSRSSARATINVACSSEFASNLAMPVLLHFTRHYSDLEITVMVFQRQMLAEVRERYDCILYLGDPTLPEFSNMSARLLGRFKFGLYASERYLRKNGIPSQPKDLLSADLVAYYDGQATANWQLTDGDEQFTIKPNAKMLSNDYWVVKLSAIHDHGICFMPTFFANLEEEAGLLVRVLPEWSSIETPVYALFWSHRFANPNISALINALSKNFDEINRYLYTAARQQDFGPDGG